MIHTKSVEEYIYLFNVQCSVCTHIFTIFIIINQLVSFLELTLVGIPLQIYPNMKPIGKTSWYKQTKKVIENLTNKAKERSGVFTFMIFYP